MDSASTVSPELQRLVRDVLMTTGHRLSFERADPGLFKEPRLHFSLDETGLGTIDDVRDEDVEEWLARTIDDLQDQWLHEEIWGGWPTCPTHGSHPLEVAVDGDTRLASWTCPSDGSMIAEVGSLSA
jgi:hypothetical protein